METRDKNNASPGMIAPDTAMPMESEYAVETTGKDGIQPDMRQQKSRRLLYRIPCAACAVTSAP